MRLPSNVRYCFFNRITNWIRPTFGIKYHWFCTINRFWGKLSKFYLTFTRVRLRRAFWEVLLPTSIGKSPRFMFRRVRNETCGVMDTHLLYTLSCYWVYTNSIQRLWITDVRLETFWFLHNGGGQILCIREAIKWCERYKPFGAVKRKDEMVFNRKPLHNSSTHQGRHTESLLQQASK